MVGTLTHSENVIIPINVFEMSESCNLTVTFGRNTYSLLFFFEPSYDFFRFCIVFEGARMI